MKWIIPTTSYMSTLSSFALVLQLIHKENRIQISSTPPEIDLVSHPAYNGGVGEIHYDDW